MAASPAPDRPPIRIEPLSPAVGLWVDGPDLHQLDAGLKAMIEDLWQLGGALLFRHQRSPEDAARVLASVLAKGPVAVDGGTAEDTSFGGDWAMPGSHSSVPPNALIFCAGASDTPLAMAGMEAAADALQMAEPDLMAQVAGVWVAHTPGGPEHPLLHRHPLSGKVCFYAPPPGETAFPGSAQLLAYLEQPQFTHIHYWAPGDVLAVDPRAVRCRWAGGGRRVPPLISLAGTAPLLEFRSTRIGEE